MYKLSGKGSEASSFNFGEWQKRYEEAKRRALSLDLTTLPELRQLIKEAEAALGEAS